MSRRKPELHAVLESNQWRMATAPPRVWCAPLESEALLERASELFPANDDGESYLALAWISAVTYLRAQSRCGWVCDNFISKASAPPA